MPKLPIRHYILKGKTPIPCDDYSKWSEWHEKADTRVAWDEVGSRAVTTIFLGIDHGLLNGKPSLFETMVMGGEWNPDLQWSYPTWDEAVKGHKTIVAELKKSLG